MWYWHQNFKASPYSRTWRTRIFKIYNGYMWVERVNKKILKIWRCITKQSETVTSRKDLERISVGSVCLITIGSLLIKSFLCPPLKEGCLLFCTCQLVCRSVDHWVMSAVDLLPLYLKITKLNWYSGCSMRVKIFPIDFQVTWSKVKV